MSNNLENIDRTIFKMDRLDDLIESHLTAINHNIENELRKHGIDENYIGNDLYKLNCSEFPELRGYEEYYRKDEFLFGVSAEFIGFGLIKIYYEPRLPKEWRHDVT